jgi:hypothetical protein
LRAHSRSKNGVAEPVIGQRFALTRWLAYAEAIQHRRKKLDGFVAMLLAMTIYNQANLI